MLNDVLKVKQNNIKHHLLIHTFLYQITEILMIWDLIKVKQYFMISQFP